MADAGAPGFGQYEDANRGVVALQARSLAKSKKLTPPANAMVGGASSLALFPPCSPLASYPSPFAEQHAAAVADLMRRTMSVSQEIPGLRTGPSDWIGRNFTPTAYGMSMQALQKMLNIKETGAAGAAQAAAAKAAANGGAGAAGKGPALKKSATGGGASGAGLLLANLIPEDATVGAGAPAAGGFPKAQKVLAVRGSSKPVESVPGENAALFGGLEPGWTPLTEAQIEAAGREQAIHDRYAMEEGTMAQLLEETVSSYWRAVDGIAADHELAEHKRAWEDGILARLAASTAVAGAAGGAGKKWIDPGLVVQRHIADEYGPSYFMPPPPAVSPGDAVEGMFVEVARGYASAGKRAMLDYALRSPRAEEHRGLDLHLVDSTRYIPLPPFTRAACGIPYTAVPMARMALTRTLYATEAVQQRLLDLWHGPRPVVGPSDGSPYSAVRLTSLLSPAFARSLPAPVKDFTTAFTDDLEAALSTLKGGWHKEAGEIVASFVIELDAEAKRVQAKAEDEEKRKLALTGNAAPKRQGKDAGDGVQAASLDPLYGDFARAAAALLLARQYAAGEAVGQEYARVAADAADAILRNLGGPNDPAPPNGRHQPGYLSPEDDTEVHLGEACSDGLAATIARMGLGLKAPSQAAARLAEAAHAMGESKDDSLTALEPLAPGVEAVLHATNAVLHHVTPSEESAMLASIGGKKHGGPKGLDPFVARLIGLNAQHLAAMPIHQLRHLVQHAHAKLESRDVVHARRLRAAFHSAAVTMSNCLRTTVYAALGDYKAFLTRYMPGQGGKARRT